MLTVNRRYQKKSDTSKRTPILKCLLSGSPWRYGICQSHQFFPRTVVHCPHRGMGLYNTKRARGGVSPLEDSGYSWLTPVSTWLLMPPCLTEWSGMRVLTGVKGRGSGTGNGLGTWLYFMSENSRTTGLFSVYQYFSSVWLCGFCSQLLLNLAVPFSIEDISVKSRYTWWITKTVENSTSLLGRLLIFYL